jgi:hypothetical protein
VLESIFGYNISRVYFREVDRSSQLVVRENRKKGCLSLGISSLAILLVALFSSFNAAAQDERVLRYLLRKKQFKEKSLIDKTHFRLSMESNDGINYFVIRNHRNFPIFREAFLTQALGGIVHRVRLVQVSNNTKLLIVYYFEGKTEYLDFQATGRLYFISWPDNDLKKIKMTRGPHYWQEFKDYRGHYFNKRYQVYLKDFNQDGIKEVSVRLGTVSRVYHLLGNNTWGTLKPE